MNEPPLWIMAGLCIMMYLACGIVAYMGCMAFNGYLKTGSKSFERIAGSLLVLVALFFGAVITHEAFFSH